MPLAAAFPKNGSFGRHADKARALLTELGKPKPAPAEIVAELCMISSGDVPGAARVVDWAKSVIPADREVAHHWLAVRLLLGVPVSLRKFEEKRLRRVMLNLRRHDAFAGWWHVEKQGSQNVTYYHRPKTKFDL